MQAGGSEMWNFTDQKSVNRSPPVATGRHRSPPVAGTGTNYDFRFEVGGSSNATSELSTSATIDAMLHRSRLTGQTTCMREINLCEGER